MSRSQFLDCPDCTQFSRRDFLRGVGGVAAVAAAGSLPIFAAARPGLARPGASGSSETLAAQLYQTLTDEQRNAVCFGWEHQRRQMVSNNWHIVPQTIGKFYTPEQQELIRGIFNGAHSEGWIEKRLQQLKDDEGGIENYSVAMFGSPGSGKFEWVMTGRHLTLRVDGDAEPGMAFGGPIFYGHAAHGFNEAANHPDNVYWYQARRANEVFKALDGTQQAHALVSGEVPSDDAATLLPHPKATERAGLPVSSMSQDQRALVEKVLDDLLAPMRKSDSAEAQRYLKANGGVESLNMAFYSADDIGKDGVWDVWLLEGPSMRWYFRGSPHVHTWVSISEKPVTHPYPEPSGA